MQATVVATSPVKDGRRVLGDKTPNASWSPAKKQTVDLEKPKSDVIPLKPLREAAKPRNLSPPPCHAGQKRTIDQVDENADNSDPRKALITSCPQREGKFQIFEDTARQAAASQTQDPLHPDAIESQTPKMDGQPRQNKESSQDRRSQSPERVDAVPASRVPTEPEARRRFIQEKAALAKRKIQTAMRRVEEENSHSLDRALSEFEAMASSRSSLVPSGSIIRPASVAGPALTVPASGARKLVASPHSERVAARITSSSPASTGTQPREEDDIPTPRAIVRRSPEMRPQTAREPVQSNSPVTTGRVRANSNSSSSSSSDSDSDSDRKCDPADGAAAAAAEAAATAAINRLAGSSRVNIVDRMIAIADRMDKEQAVNGLMKLMETTTEYDNLDTWTG